MNKILILSIFLVLISCTPEKSTNNKVEKSKPTTTHSLENESQKKPSVPASKATVLGSYKGKIGKNLEVLFHLENDKGTVSGFYFYKKIGIDIQVIGNIKGDSLIAYELDYKMDTVAILKGNISESSINGKWMNAKSKKEYPLVLEKINVELTPLPASLEGKYYDGICNLTLSIFETEGEYFYTYTSKDRKLNGKVTFDREEELYINLDNIEYAEDYFDVSLEEEDLEKSKEYEELKRIGKRHMGIQLFYSPEEIILQNYGNAMNYYVKLSDCGEKYIHFMKQ